MAVRQIQVGQVWKHNESGDSYLVTKVYTEGLSTFAVLRKTGAETESRIRVKVERAAGAQNLPGYSFTQESESF
jgi:hypothetical protein